jgi:hypothetical protein
VDLYADRAREIFTGPPLLNTLRRIFFGSMYSTQNLHDVIAEELGPDARGWSLNDSPIDLLITAKGIPDGEAWYFVKNNPKKLRLHRAPGAGRLHHRLRCSADLLRALDDRGGHHTAELQARRGAGRRWGGRGGQSCLPGVRRGVPNSGGSTRAFIGSVLGASQTLSTSCHRRGRQFATRAV